MCAYHLALHANSPMLALFQRFLKQPSLSLVYAQDGLTPLHGAETAEVVKALVDAKANIHAQNDVSAYAIGEGVCVCM